MLRVSFSLLSLVCRASFFSFYFYFFWGSKFVFQSFKFLALFSCCASIILDFELSPDMYNVKLHSSFFVLWLILDLAFRNQPGGIKASEGCSANCPPCTTTGRYSISANQEFHTWNFENPHIRSWQEAKNLNKTETLSDR